MPKGFQFPIQNPSAALWTTLADDTADKDPLTAQRGAHMVHLVGRLKPGVSIVQARADLDLIARNLAAQYPDSNKQFPSAVVVPELENLVGNTRPALHVLFAAVMLVLLIACANVAGLMLTRTSRRRQEIAVRAAMGATRFGIIRQVLVESVFLSLCGGALGVALAVVLLKTMVHFVPQNLPRLDQVAVDGTVMGFAALASILTGVLFGVLPAWRMSRLDPSLALREGTRSVTSGRGQHRLNSILVVAETAIGLVLLVGAGLLIHSFVRVLNVDPGFDSHHVLTVDLGMSDTQYPDLKKVQFYEQLLPRLAALPGVETVSAGYPLPLSEHNIGIGFAIEGRPVAKGDEPDAPVTIVTPDFFRTMRIPMLSGPAFLTTDDSKAPAVIIINQAFARKYFPGEDPIGKRMKPGLGDGIMNEPMREIIGVVGDVKRKGITAEMPAQYYLPFKQAIILDPTVVLRTAGDPLSLIGPLRAQLAQVDSNVPLFDIKTLDDYLSLSAAQPRFQTVLITFFAAMALLLSAIGLYAVLSYMVAQRTMEIGLATCFGRATRRCAGADSSPGIDSGGDGSGDWNFRFAAADSIHGGDVIWGEAVRSADVCGVSAVLLVVSLIASSAPAFRAAHLDPMRTLREQ